MECSSIATDFESAVSDEEIEMRRDISSNPETVLLENLQMSVWTGIILLS